MSVNCCLGCNALDFSFDLCTGIVRGAELLGSARYRAMDLCRIPVLPWDFLLAGRYPIVSVSFSIVFAKLEQMVNSYSYEHVISKDVANDFAKRMDRSNQKCTNTINISPQSPNGLNEEAQLKHRRVTRDQHLANITLRMQGSK